MTEGRAGQAVIAETHEQSTEVGVFAPLGAQLALGPGFLLGEGVGAHTELPVT